MSYECTGCGYTTGRWMGFCPQCRGGTLQEAPGAAASRSGARPVLLGGIDLNGAARLPVGIGEVDRVLGGGLVPGSAVLLGGEPGIGKSTLLLQMTAAFAASGRPALLATAEESADQVARRAERLAFGGGESVYLLAERDVDAILAAAADLRPAVLVVDSIQTVASAEGSGAAGSLGQVRECAARLLDHAKATGTAVILVGHVTKDGSIAGPKVLEHAVDVVLALEGESDGGLRILRGMKNRFGATHQVGVFEMGDGGLAPVSDPSRALVGDWHGGMQGSVVFPVLEGRRPLLVELQALVTPASGPQPRRSVRGLDTARVHQLLAVLERHARVPFSGFDVYVGVTGGVRVREPAADLPVALALVSSRIEHTLGALAAWGEVGLTGEVRPVRHHERRREEAMRLGIETVVSPPTRGMRVTAALLAAGLAGAAEAAVALPPRRVVGAGV